MERCRSAIYPEMNFASHEYVKWLVNMSDDSFSVYFVFLRLCGKSGKLLDLIEQLRTNQTLLMLANRPGYRDHDSELKTPATLNFEEAIRYG